MDWYLDALKQYAVFTGRARRRAYWMFVLLNFALFVILMGVDVYALGFTLGTGVLSTLYSLAITVPALAVVVRRLHDTNRSGWWLLVGLVPLVGGIVLLVFLVSAGTAGENSYGPDPRAVAADGLAAT